MSNPASGDDSRSKRPLIAAGVAAGLGGALGAFAAHQMDLGIAGPALGGGLGGFLGCVIGWVLSRGGEE